MTDLLAGQPAPEDVHVPTTPSGGGRAFLAACTRPWAIQPEALTALLEIANREWPTPESVAARVGRRLDSTRTAEMREGGVAIIPVQGPIFRFGNIFTEMSGATTVQTLMRDFHTALHDPTVTSILLDVNSPGGEADGINELAQAIYVARDQKRIVAYAGGDVCSAAYWIASAASELVIDRTAWVGSIGTVMAVSNPEARSAKDIQFVSSQSPRKRPNPSSESGRDYLQSIVDQLTDVFVEAVARNRDVTPETVLRDFGRGGVLIGEAAVAVGMADRLGSFEGTVAALAAPAHSAPRGVAAMGFREKWAEFKANLSPDEAAEMVGEGHTTATLAPLVSGQLLTSGHDAETEARIAALEADKAKAEAAAAQAAQAAQMATERVAAMEAAARRERFTAEVLGRSDSNGTRWIGPPDQHVTLLEHLAATAGEDSDLFKGYVQDQRARAVEVTASLAHEIGRPGTDADTGATATIMQRAQALADKDGISLAQAVDRIAASEPALYAEHRAGR